MKSASKNVTKMVIEIMLHSNKENNKHKLVIKVGGAFMQDRDAALALLTTIS